MSSAAVGSDVSAFFVGPVAVEPERLRRVGMQTVRYRRPEGRHRLHATAQAETPAGTPYEHLRRMTEPFITATTATPSARRRPAAARSRMMRRRSAGRDSRSAARPARAECKTEAWLAPDHLPHTVFSASTHRASTVAHAVPAPAWTGLAHPERVWTPSAAGNMTIPAHSTQLLGGVGFEALCANDSDLVGLRATVRAVLAARQHRARLDGRVDC